MIWLSVSAQTVALEFSSAVCLFISIKYIICSSCVVSLQLQSSNLCKFNQTLMELVGFFSFIRI